MNTKKAAVFDMDGVITDTEPLKFQAYAQVFHNEFGVKIEDDKGRLGLSEANAVKFYLDKHGLTGDVEDLIKKKREAYYLLQETKDDLLIPGVEDFLKSLKSAGWTICLATNSDKRSTDAILTRFGLHKLFVSIITAEQIIKKKPHPEIYLKSLEAVKAESAQSWAFEDSPTGVEAARAAGMKCFGITTGVTSEKLLQAGAERAAEDFTALSAEDFV